MLTTQKTKTLVGVAIKDKSQIVKKRIYFRDIEDVICKHKEEEMRGSALLLAKKGSTISATQKARAIQKARKRRQKNVLKKTLGMPLGKPTFPTCRTSPVLGFPKARKTIKR